MDTNDKHKLNQTPFLGLTSLGVLVNLQGRGQYFWILEYTRKDKVQESIQEKLTIYGGQIPKTQSIENRLNGGEKTFKTNSKVSKLKDSINIYVERTHGINGKNTNKPTPR